MVISTQEVSQMKGQAVFSGQGEKIGEVKGFYYDIDSHQPEWLGVSSGFLGTKQVVVPIEVIHRKQDGLTVPYSKDKVKNAPEVSEEFVPQDRENELRRYYELDGQMGRTAAPSSGITPSQTESSMTRSEEQLRVGKEERETGHVRLRKWVETEPVEQDVQLRHETAHVEREAINQPGQSGQIGEQEIDVPLKSEEPVVQKDTIARERVSVDKEQEMEDRKISEQLRKERIDVEGADEDRMP